MTLEDYGWSCLFQSATTPGEQAGRVLVASHGIYRLACHDGERDAVAAGQLLYQAESAAHLPVTGDWVVYEGNDVGRIVRVLPRRSKVSRKAAGNRTEEQVLAANVDTCFLVSGLDRDFNLRRIERYVLMARQSGAEPVIVLNKTDLATGVAAVTREVEETLRSVPVVAISALQGEGLGALDPFLSPCSTVALLGSSGAGKSTLINSLLGVDRQQTGAVRPEDQRGRHTTTARELIRLEGGALLIDMPGLRELQPWLAGEAFDEAFDDIAALAVQCRYGDCGHEGEPGCAVREAVESGGLDSGRLANFFKLRREAAYLERKTDDFAAREQKQRWKRIHKAMRHMDKRR